MRCLRKHQHVLKMSYAFSNIKIPYIDITKCVQNPSADKQKCLQIANALRDYGCLVVKDARVKQSQNQKFLDIMELYFSQRSKQFDQGDTITDVYPQHYYRVGATPQYLQKAKSHQKIRQHLKGQNSSLTTGEGYDVKWRYMWTTQVQQKNSQNIVPKKNLPGFAQTMELWGKRMVDSSISVSQMAALGLGLNQYAFSSLLKGSSHKLSPTGSDLQKHKVGTVFAAFHYDLNFLTIHGKSRYPGLFAWTRNGQKFEVKVPQGHLLIQAGKQLQWLTGGYIKYGFHEVIYTEEAKRLKDEAIKKGKIPWRVSSTLFNIIRGDVLLEPLQKFRSQSSLKQYPPMLSQDYILKQIEQIKLA